MLRITKNGVFDNDKTKVLFDDDPGELSLHEINPEIFSNGGDFIDHQAPQEIYCDICGKIILPTDKTLTPVVKESDDFEPETVFVHRRCLSEKRV